MTDREKIIKIIEKNGVYNGRSLSFDYYVIQPDDLADALIKNGYGNVAERKQAVKEFAEKLKKKARGLTLEVDKGPAFHIGNVVLIDDIDKLLKEYEK